MELWDLYDKNRLPLKQTGVRGKALPSGTYHMVVHVCIFNDQNQLLIQKRHPDKSSWSNFWDLSVGGSALKGESSNEAAARETEEELGLKLDFSLERPVFTINFSTGFDDYYVLKKNVEVETLSLQASEVSAAKWSDYQNILDMIDQGSFVPYHKELIGLLFAMYNKTGTLNR